MLIPEIISSSWHDFLTVEIRNKLSEIEIAIGTDYTPSKERVMRFLTVDLDKISVCILGQDVYFQPGVATGRSFEVHGLNSWDAKFKQVSLKNMVRLIHKSYRNISEYGEIKKYSEIIKEIKDGSFPILPPHQWFDRMEEQGVLFLNSYLTCKEHYPNSHKEVWMDFSKELLKYISQKKPDLIWFLWGNEAIGKKEYIQNGVFYESRHPMLCSESYENDFLKSNCFRDTFSIINWLG